MSCPFGRSLPRLLAAALAGTSCVAGLALPATAGAVTTVTTRTSTLTIYGKPPPKLSPGASGGAAAPAIHLPTTGRIRVPQVGTHIRSTKTTHVRSTPTTRVPSTGTGHVPATGTGAGPSTGTAPPGSAASATKAPVTPLSPTAARAPARTAARSGGGLSTAAIVLAVLAALIALACAAWGVARMLAYEPHWTRSARHVVAEAGFRVSSTWDEFSDWIRLGH